MTRQFAIEVQRSTDPAIEAIVNCAISDNQHKQGPLLPILHQIQSELRHVPKDCVPIIASALNLSRAEVHGVIGFYHTFTDKPQGQHVIEVCRAESCQAVGGRDLEAHFKDSLGIDFGETTDDGKFSLEPVYCLGNCACSPSVRVGTRIFGRVTSSSATQMIKQLKEQE